MLSVVRQEAISEFSSDEFMSGDSNSAAPTEKAVRGFLTRGKMDSTSGILVPPRGAKSGRPTGGDLLTGGLRFDTDVNGFEFYNGTSWLPLGAYANVDVTVLARLLLTDSKHSVTPAVVVSQLICPQPDRKVTALESLMSQDI